MIAISHLDNVQMHSYPIMRVCRPWPTPISLLAFPDDVLSLVFSHVMCPLKVGGNYRVVETSFKAGLPLATTCRRLHSIFHLSLRHLELWQSGRISSRAVSALAMRIGPALRSLVLRGCSRVTSSALISVAANCPGIHTLDLSYVPLTDTDIAVLVSSLHNLHELRLRGCDMLTDRALSIIANGCKELLALDVSAIPGVTDIGITFIAQMLGASLRTIVCSNCTKVSDNGLRALGKYAVALRSLTVRGLSRISNKGIDGLCKMRGQELVTLDVLDCVCLHAERYVNSVRRYCPNIAWRVGEADGRSLKQVVISSLTGYIFYVTGSDICNGKSAVYFLLVDSGTSDSFRVSIGSSSLDLTNFGSILASCFGERPSQYVKDTMLMQYGLDLASDDDESSSTMN